MKKLDRYFMQSTDTPIVLWPLVYNFAAEIRSRLASNKPGMQGRTPFENTYGYTPDISEYIIVLLVSMDLVLGTC